MSGISSESYSESELKSLVLTLEDYSLPWSEPFNLATVGLVFVLTTLFSGTNNYNSLAEIREWSEPYL